MRLQVSRAPSALLTFPWEIKARSSIFVARLATFFEKTNPDFSKKKMKVAKSVFTKGNLKENPPKNALARCPWATLKREEFDWKKILFCKRPTPTFAPRLFRGAGSEKPLRQIPFSEKQNFPFES